MLDLIGMSPAPVESSRTATIRFGFFDQQRRQTCLGNRRLIPPTAVCYELCVREGDRICVDGILTIMCMLASVTSPEVQVKEFGYINRTISPKLVGRTLYRGGVLD